MDFLDYGYLLNLEVKYNALSGSVARSLRMKISNALLLTWYAWVVNATLKQCRLDCKAPTELRPVGPTRPYFEYDQFGEKLSLTKQYPHSIAQTLVNVTGISFNTTLRLFIPHYSSGQSVGVFERNAVINVWRDQISSYYKSRDQRIIYSSSVLIDEVSGSFYLDYKILTAIIAEFNGYNENNASVFYRYGIIPRIQKVFNSSYPMDNYATGVKDTLHEAYLIAIDIDESSFQIERTTKEMSPNPYTKFCSVGCSIFFSDDVQRDVLDENNKTQSVTYFSSCLQRCDEIFHYNVSVGYNDFVEVARLECRDGCIMAVQRCQPGYYCQQLSTDDVLEEGVMQVCPMGTYRDVSYDDVSRCSLCPPGTFRNQVKGRDSQSCFPCPARTYNPIFGAISSHSCIRCPAGTFNDEKGAGKCNCITAMSCDERYDAEKRDTLPYIGRW